MKSDNMVPMLAAVFGTTTLFSTACMIVWLNGGITKHIVPQLFLLGYGFVVIAFCTYMGTRPLDKRGSQNREK